MYGRNGSGVVKEVKGPSWLHPAEERAFESQHTSNRPIVSANLSAVMLENNQMKRPRRAIDVFVSLAGHTVLLGVAILLPLYFSGAIDLNQMETTYLVAPPLPPPPPAPAAANRAIRHPKSFFSDTKLYTPRVIPKRVAVVKDLSNPPEATVGVPGGVIGGVPGGQLGGVLGGILGDMGRMVPPPPPKPAAHRGPYKVGGKVQAPRIIDEVQPRYPALARDVRAQGDVVIDSVIDAQGDVTEMKLVRGNPLLVAAAFNAVRQWKYQPTLLNGTPVAVEMHVVVHFSLSS